MNRFIDFIGRLSESTTDVSDNLPDFGPVDIPDYGKFLEKSKERFLENIELSTETKELIKLKDKNVSLTDFKKLSLVGAGAFGLVYLVNNELTGELHAMKAVLKKTVVELRQVNNTRTEKLVLECTNCPFILRLDYFFKDNSYLYFVMPFIQAGELFQHLVRIGRFDETAAMFHVAQVILALEYLHYMDIVYRDLKPENILLDHTGYIKLTDFGFCKILQNGRTYTFCGTWDYLAPEIILNEGYGKAVDWWAVGILLFELTTGNPPFKDKNESKKLRKIVQGRFKCPDYLSADLKHLITQALQKDLTRRYGNLKGGVNDFKNHNWFKPLNWHAVVCRKATPEYLPTVVEQSDNRQSKKEYKSLVIADDLEFGTEFADF